MFLRIFIVILFFGSASMARAGEIVFENSVMKVVFNENGSLRNITSKLTGWKVERRPELALSFSMNVPLPNQDYDPIFGNKQKSVRYEVNKQEKKVTFIWDNLVSEKGGKLNITFYGSAQLTDDGLVYTAKIVNKSPYVVETVRWPQFGDLSIPDKKEEFSQMGIDYGGMKKLQLYPKFDNYPGYFAVDYPMQWMETPDTPFSLIGNENEGLYVGYHDTTAVDLVQFKAELKPGYVSYEFWDSGVNPKTDTLAGQPARIEFTTVQFAYANPGETKTLKPVVIQPYKGDWHKGADIYKAWRSTWFKAPKNPGWLNNVNSWQQIQLNNPEDNIRYTYHDLIGIGKDCAANGVKAIQVTGWTVGGQDRGNPSHDTDPRLGTTEDLKNAISKIQKLGVKVILFTKFTWADRTTDWYKKELIKYAMKDPYGDPYFFNGYAYQTDVQLAEINTRHFSPMCHLSADWRAIADKEFKKVIDLGADGMLFDENSHHGGAHYCFDKTHGHKVPANVFSGDEILARGFSNIRNKINPDFIFAGEGNYDLEFRQYQLSYFRIDLSHVPIQRYIDPYSPMMIAVSGYNDRNIINSALMYRYIISYEPRNFKGRLSEFPMTVAYGNKVDALRTKYRNFLWDGEFRHTVGAKVLVDGKPYEQYSLFIDKTSGKRAVVVVNEDYEKALKFRIELKNHRQLYCATPEKPEAAQFADTGTIPPNSAMVIFEK